MRREISDLIIGLILLIVGIIVMMSVFFMAMNLAFSAGTSSGSSFRKRREWKDQKLHSAGHPIAFRFSSKTILRKVTGTSYKENGFSVKVTQIMMTTLNSRILGMAHIKSL